MSSFAAERDFLDSIIHPKGNLSCQGVTLEQPCLTSQEAAFQSVA